MHATFIFLQSWSDEKLKWDPNDYNGLKTLRMPIQMDSTRARSVNARS
jgi:hypothetical protein